MSIIFWHGRYNFGSQKCTGTRPPGLCDYSHHSSSTANVYLCNKSICIRHSISPFLATRTFLARSVHFWQPKLYRGGTILAAKSVPPGKIGCHSVPLGTIFARGCITQYNFLFIADLIIRPQLRNRSQLYLCMLLCRILRDAVSPGNYSSHYIDSFPAVF